MWWKKGEGGGRGIIRPAGQSEEGHEGVEQQMANSRMAEIAILFFKK